MRCARWLGIAAISIVGAFASSCMRQDEPLSPLVGQPLRSIAVHDVAGHEVTLTSPEDLEFVANHLTGLEVRREFKMSHEFNLDFYPQRGSPFRLRLGETQIGPDVPASKVADRWYFKDRALYEFIKAKVSAVPQ